MHCVVYFLECEQPMERKEMKNCRFFFSWFLFLNLLFFLCCTYSTFTKYTFISFSRMVFFSLFACHFDSCVPLYNSHVGKSQCHPSINHVTNWNWHTKSVNLFLNKNSRKKFFPQITIQPRFFRRIYYAPFIAFPCVIYVCCHFFFYFIYEYAMALKQFNYGSGNLNIYRNEKKSRLEKWLSIDWCHICSYTHVCSFARKKNLLCYHMYRSRGRQKFQPGPIFEFTIKC